MYPLDSGERTGREFCIPLGDCPQVMPRRSTLFPTRAGAEPTAWHTCLSDPQERRDRKSAHLCLRSVAPTVRGQGRGCISASIGNLCLTRFFISPPALSCICTLGPGARPTDEFIAPWSAGAGLLCSPLGSCPSVMSQRLHASGESFRFGARRLAGMSAAVCPATRLSLVGSLRIQGARDGVFSLPWMFSPPAFIDVSVLSITL